MNATKPIQILVASHEPAQTKKGEPCTIVSLVTKSGRTVKDWCNTPAQLANWPLGSVHTVILKQVDGFNEVTKIDPAAADALAAFLKD
jgi:predicted glycoside hydrolase/deacetylase ChbG (UPF0249 family)